MTDPKDIAVEQSKPGNFSLIERLQNRNLPEEDVDVYLDERLGWDLIRLEEKHADAKKDAEARALEAKIEKVRKQLQESRYVFTLRGMSSERYDEIIDEVTEQYPFEYEENVNPLTGQRTKVEIPNEDRDQLFNTLFLAETIVKVQDPDGNVDESIDAAAVELIKRLAPLDAVRRITNLATRMRMAVEWMDVIQDEDFSPKP
jgi:hypothetical protein